MKYLHPDNKHLEWKDWRLPENRKELFWRWFNWRLSGKTIDHFNWNVAYANTSNSPTGKPMTKSEKYWFSYLFGTTYHSNMAWILYSHYPDPTKANLDDVNKWVGETIKGHRFNTDARYNKGHNKVMWRSFLDWVDKNGQGDIEKAFNSCLRDTEEESFENITKELRTLHKYGRMTTWLCTQCLWETADFPITPNTMYTDDPSNRSVWNGMCFYRGLEHMTVGDNSAKYAGYKPTVEDRKSFKEYEKKLMAEAHEKVEDKTYLSYFTLETHLCQFKKILTGGDYPGQGVGQVVEWYHQLKPQWPNVDFTAFEERNNSSDMYDSIRWIYRSAPFMGLLKETGQCIFLDELYPDMPDMMKELQISKEELTKGNCSPLVKSKIEDFKGVSEGSLNWLEKQLLGYA